MDVSTDDRSLARAVTAGDEAAFRALYRRHTPAMYGLVTRLLGEAGADADDVIQEAWIRAVRALPRFEWRSTLRTWLCGIAVNRVREQVRRQGRRLDDQPLDGHAVGFTPRPGGHLDLEAAVATLPDGYRTVLLLHDWEGYSHPEIARRLDIAVGTSRSQLFHARRALRRLLGPDGEAPA